MIQDSASTPIGHCWIQLDKMKSKQNKNKSIQIDRYITIAAYLSKKGRDKERRSSSFNEFSSNCPLKAGRQIGKQT